ncbi:MAG TPA: TonB-dependent receptor, partial [Chakrabartia sp.]|nr:TonB-dependent receptor [Chakrabartia sp.]
MNPVIRLLAATALTGLTQSALTESARAQQTAAQDDAEPMEILVTGTRLPGAVLGDIKPEITFSPADVRSLGVSSVSELVSELAAQTGSGQGRGGEAPIVLLNGGRISGFSEVRDIPSEAIARVEILPEEVALKYGYRATQKVMNIVLRRRFRAVTVELEGTLPTEGGQWAGEAGSTLFRTGTNGRLNLALDYERASALTEAERGIIQQASAWPYAAGGNISAISAGAEIDPALSLLKGGLTSVAGVPGSALTRVPTLADFAAGAVNSTDMGAYRTLQAETETVKANAVFARPLSGGTS